MTDVFEDIRNAVERSAEPVSLQELAERRAVQVTHARRRQRRLVAAVALPVAVVVATVFYVSNPGPLRPSRGAHRAPTSDATLVLARLADVAARHAALAPQTGQYVFSSRHGLGLRPVASGGNSASSPTFWTSFDFQIQSWDSTTADGQQVEHNGPLTPARPADAAVWRAEGGSPLAGATSRTSKSQATASAAKIGSIDLAALSSDPGELEQQLARDTLQQNGATPTGFVGARVTIFDLADELLSAWQTAPEVRSAAFRVLATQPGVTVQLNVPNHAGRLGTAILVTQEGIRMQIIVDPTTSSEIGYRRTVVDPRQAGLPGNSAGLVGWVDIQPSIVVNALGSTARPPGKATRIAQSV